MSTDDPSATAQRLLTALEALGPRPALTWIGPEGRTELSGRVLANWIIKAANHLADEIALDSDGALHLDLPPHWKRLVLALAGWLLGADVRSAPVAPSDAPHGILVIATDRPFTEVAEQADELLALDAASLAMRASMALPPLVHDWVQEIRGAGDELTAPIGRWTGPLPVAVAETTAISTSAAITVTTDGIGSGQTEASDAAAILGAWLAGGSVEITLR